MLLTSSVAFFRQSHDRLSSLYQDLSCQHHLIQESFDKSPEIPGLTPVGFAQWMTTWILAYPDQEARRLEKVMVSMPIDADGEIVDGKPERLPKVHSDYSCYRMIAHLLLANLTSSSTVKGRSGGQKNPWRGHFGIPRRSGGHVKETKAFNH